LIIVDIAFFFFQAVDGIRDRNVTGVQTCALPIFGGQTNLLTFPAFNDVNKIYSLYMMMENEDEMMKLLSNTSSGVKVTIGNENEREAMNHLSLITSSYNLGLNQMGSIGLLGPTRMEYKKVITLLKGLSYEMSDLLNQVRRKDE